MFWIIMPLIVSGDKEVAWNMFFGSFLGVVAITFVVSMKGSFVAFKASFFQYNCCNKVPQLQVWQLPLLSCLNVVLLYPFFQPPVDVSIHAHASSPSTRAASTVHLLICS